MAQRGRTPTIFLMFVSYCCVYNSANGWGDFLDTLGGVVPLGVANLLGRWGDFVRPVYKLWLDTNLTLEVLSKTWAASEGPGCSECFWQVPCQMQKGTCSPQCHSRCLGGRQPAAEPMLRWAPLAEHVFGFSGKCLGSWSIFVLL